MALELAKKQVIYSINKVMDLASKDTITLNKNVTFTIDGWAYKIQTIHKPDTNHWYIDLETIPMWGWELKHTTLNLNTKLSMLEEVFRLVFKESYDKSIFTSRSADKVLLSFAEEYNPN